MIIKYVGKEWINWLMQWYFTITGVGSVSKVRVLYAIQCDASSHSDYNVTSIPVPNFSSPMDTRYRVVEDI